MIDRLDLDSVRARRLALALAIAFLAINVAMLIWYLFIGYQSSFHSDAAAKVLLAREIVAARQYFPNDWNYVNGDLFVLFGHTFIVPLLAFLPAGYLVHALSGVVTSALVLSGIWFVSGLTEIARTRRLVIVAVAAAGISGFMAENLYGQASYGVIIYSACYILFFAYRYLRVVGKARTYWAIALVCALALVFWANPQRALITYGLPLLAAVLWYRGGLIVACEPERRKAVRRLVVMVLAGIVFGGILHAVVLLTVNNVPGAGAARWLPYDMMLRNAGLVPEEFLATFGGLPTAGLSIVDKVGMYGACRLLVVLGILALVPLSLVAALRWRRSGLGFIAVFALTAFLAALFLQVTTTVADMSDPIQAGRYLVPSLCLLLVVVLAMPIQWRRTPVIAGVLLAVAVGLVTSGYPTFVMSTVSSDIAWGMPGQHHADANGLKDFLLTNDLHYGYASYWNAGVLSVLSSEKVLVRQVEIVGGVPVPMRHLSSERWYRPSAWTGETFLLVTGEEAAKLDWELLASWQVVPLRELAYENFKVFVFPGNIASDLPGWGEPLSSPVTYPATSRSLHQVGRFDARYAGDGPALVAGQREVGALHYGPFIRLEPGRYAVTFRVLAANQADGAFRLDVAAFSEATPLVEKTVTFGGDSQTLTFTLNEERSMEFRVWTLGTERVAFKSVTVELE